MGTESLEPTLAVAASTGVEDHLSRQTTRKQPTDEERLPPSAQLFGASTDPFLLATKLKSPDDINNLQCANTTRKRHNPLTKSKDAVRTRRLQGFYEDQNENIERLLKPVDEHVREAKEFNADNLLKFKIAVWGSFGANLMLVVLQLYGAISSGSLSLFTTMADAIFDPMSNLTLLLSNKAVNRVDARKFPAGKARIETAGNIYFCFIMTAVSMILIAFSAKELVDGSEAETQKFHLPSVIAVAAAFTTKFILFLYCWALRNSYSQVRILWEDHRNDLFINGFGILTSVGGSKLRWWLDPAGAIVLSVLITALWQKTAYSEFQLLIGKSADTKFLQLITYICKSSSRGYPLTLQDLLLTRLPSNDPLQRYRRH